MKPSGNCKNGTEERADREWRKCRADAHYFLQTYGKVRDPKRGIIPFEDWAHLVSLLDLCEQHRLIIILKARQLGITWLMAGYGLWKALFHEGANVIMLSKGESEASEMLDYTRFMHTQLPDFLRCEKGKDQSSLLTFPPANSKIRALPATEDAGLGFGGATLLILDEWEFHPYAPENYTQIKPMIDAGGQLVILSAVNKQRSDTKFKEIYRGAKAGDNNFYSVFLPYNLLEERTPQWYEDRRKEYDDWEMEALYPRTEEEALAPSKAVCRFDIQSLKAMLDECQKPIREEYNGQVKIYKDSVAGRKYCFAIDPSEGDYDPSAGGIIDWQTCEEVAEYHGKIHLDEQARMAYDLYTRYNNAFCAPERNASGLTLISKLKDMGVTNWYSLDKKKEKLGWWTSSQNRPVMLADLAEAVRLRLIRIPNRDAINEFFSFIRTEKHPDGKATGGAHDDYVIMWAILYQIRKSIPTGESWVYHRKYD